ncbi:cation:proton antiporter [Desmospora activa]|uniref:Sodium/proton-potassium antiporter GerN (CPA2 family) n=1 Tax=Desmospora activa DSM 45169 TaxID=1121389 RepID=A0A2T4ZCP9_9BACL|nr:cation:proton antiporter [Desmospora activa]PTM59678.1 sodium/proton-potassium antiporter GerN (CPA2 family) [Desmospora activa DSM 45169]
MLFIATILIIILSTKLAGDLSVRLGQPSVLGKLLVGIIIGPAVLGWVDNDNLIETMAEIGVLLLMFIAGLETDIKELNRTRNSSVAVGVGGIILPLLGGYFAGLAFGLDSQQSLFIGLLLSATSVSITVQTLKDLGRLGSRESTTILGAAVVDDVLVVIMLAFMMSFAGGEDAIALVIGKKFLFFAAIALLGWKVVPWVMKKLSPLKVSESLISAALIVCFFFSYLAEEMGVAGIIGAFAAGVALSTTKYKEEVEHKVEPIAYAIFVPVFFVSIGLNVSFAGLADQIWLIVVMTVIAVITKLVGGTVGARLTGFDKKSALGIGSGMVSRGEVALIIASTGLTAELLSQEYFTAMVLVIILTTLIAPVLLKVFFGDANAESEKKEETASS